MKRMCTLLMLLAGVCLTSSAVLAAELVTEMRVESATGQPVKKDFTIAKQGFKDFYLKLINGEDDGSNRISSAVIRLNGIKVFIPADFNQKVSTLERAVVLEDADNTLSVTLNSNPGGVLQIQLYGEASLSLPADPGSAGDETLEGVDANDNGIRDDIERWIGLTYRDSEKTRLALTQAYYPIQNFMIHARDGDRDAVYNDMTVFQRAGECLDYIRSDDAHILIEELRARIVNTSDRVYAYLGSSRMLGGGSFPSAPFSKWNQSCTFDPDSLAD